jgi:hypothetical protein
MPCSAPNPASALSVPRPVHTKLHTGQHSVSHEQGSIGFQLTNEQDKAIKSDGKVDVIHYATRGIPGDIWLPEVYKAGACNDSHPGDMAARVIRTFQYSRSSRR